MQSKICCVTGHREIAPNKVEHVKAELKREILAAIDAGYSIFLSGFAQGVDLLFSEIVIELKCKYAIHLEAAIPYRGRLYTKDSDFQRLIRRCDAVHICAEVYSSDCFLARNRLMADRAGRIIAVFDGHEKSGTAATIRYAKKLGREIHLVPI